jgi:hypothetical protein
MTPAWTIGAWPPVLLQSDRDPHPNFVHLGTHVSARPAADWPRSGQTAWGGRAADSVAGLSWDWIEIADGVIAIADPMTMTTNLRLLGSEGEVLTAHSAAPHLNRIAHQLPWQAEVRHALGLLKASEAIEKVKSPAALWAAGRGQRAPDVAFSHQR